MKRKRRKRERRALVHADLVGRLAAELERSAVRAQTINKAIAAFAVIIRNKI